uniref:Uncharacterized protein n=1 Tax=Anguilla anguilla TaxID=7936 RepID=A0A0E9WT20_ANGAN
MQKRYVLYTTCLWKMCAEISSLPLTSPENFTVQKNVKTDGTQRNPVLRLKG